MDIQKIKEKISSGHNFTNSEKYLALMDDTVNYLLKEGKFGKKTIHTNDHYFYLRKILKSVIIPEDLLEKIHKVDLILLENSKKFYQSQRNIGITLILAGIVCYFLFGFIIGVSVIVLGTIRIYAAVEYYKNAKRELNEFEN
ncbi:hypothetical protein ASE21_12335 [Flavobacterium sp. Root901]|uniref:hypothetical protein n=1 Tax=Flavobacterium sp. Root901 TaxID=1736605 RepID=UPI00070A711C|nr:hypothetical protein [Flavobacterium sp. Root901]KRD10481.1 hypothetical protein ASE21_12335 [Flavobacterium sp. Root901]